jgi:hypothetical protein
MKAMLFTVAAGSVLFAPLAAQADEPRSATEPYVMMESGEVTNVIDAFDDGDVFDLNISLGFDYATKSATILRETSIRGPGLTSGGYTSNLMNVANYSETTSRLVPRLDIGIYKDLAAYIKLPIVLSNSRELTAVEANGSDPGTANAQDVVLAGAPADGRLFSLPFKSPDRSGLDYIGVGLQLDILSQARDRTKPTWFLGVEGRFSVGEPMHACNENPGAVRGGTGTQVKCAAVSDVNRNGQRDNDFEGEGLSARDPGVSRGTIGLEVRTMMSKRIKYVEPYGGFTALFEFQQDASDYALTNVQSSIVNRPPIVGTVTAGLMIIPWENREKFGRLTFDTRIEGTYHSEGRDYSELFDALGSSDAPTMRNPQFAGFEANPSFDREACLATGNPAQCSQSVVDANSQKTYFTGLTDVQAYGSIRISGSATWQASEYVKFTFGMGFRHDQAHGISADQPCNPQFKDDITKSGPCRSGDISANSGSDPRATGVPNPNYRATINSVGRRFYVDNSDTFDLFFSGTVMF